MAVIVSSLPPGALLESLQQVEWEHGRVRGERWGPRILDLDIVVSDIVSVTDPLIPHPRTVEREFVLRPLVEVWPEAEVAEGVTALGALSSLEPQGVELVSEEWVEETDFRP